MKFTYQLQDVATCLARIKEQCAFLMGISPTMENIDFRNTQAELMLYLLDWILQHCSDPECLQRAIQLREASTRLLLSCQRSNQVSCTQVCQGIRGAGMTHASTGVGRPRVVVNIDNVELLRSAGFTWKEALLVSRCTIWRRLRECGSSLSKYSDISDSALDSVVRDFRHSHPHAGQAMIKGYLLSTGLSIQRFRIRESVSRVDPLSSFIQCRQPVTRRQYTVPGPNSLGHIDGHHSLIHW